jgi:catechol 2,3-dioxygenase-like lactoylglutathione lyase family enzyme
VHRSRLCGLIIDCHDRDLDAAADFWSRALGYAAERSKDPADSNYVLLRTDPEDPHLELQRVEHPSGVHLDIETDDVGLEVARLEKLGARRLRRVRDWWVMEAPSGHRFCVVPVQTADFERRSKLWESEDA